MNFSLFYFTVLIGIGNCQSLGKSPSKMDWETFKTYHVKAYDSVEAEESARMIFERRVADVMAHNLLFSEGKVSYFKELNSFSDIDRLRFNRRNEFQPVNLEQILEAIEVDYSEETPNSFDWRDKHCVTPVKDQGDCVSDWAFSAIGAMESQILIAGGCKTPIFLSEQQLLDCDGDDGGCNAGFFTNAWNYIRTNGGIANESVYPYKSGGGHVGECKFNASMAQAKIVSYVAFQPIDEDHIKKPLVNVGPISIEMDADDLEPYSGGIYSCNGNISLNHHALLIGYDTDKKTGEDYWIVKNSWGAEWGENGFFRLSRHPDKDCGIREIMAYPKVVNGGMGQGVRDNFGWKLSLFISIILMFQF